MCSSPSLPHAGKSQIQTLEQLWQSRPAHSFAFLVGVCVFITLFPAAMSFLVISPNIQVLNHSLVWLWLPTVLFHFPL